MHTFAYTHWQHFVTDAENAKALNALENGELIVYPHLSFKLKEAEKIFLSPHYSNGKAKNISFDVTTHKLSGANGSPEEHKKLAAMMLRFNQNATLLISKLFPSYMPALQIARTSYRPVEIQGRKTSYKKDDSRLHVDAFSASPNQGKRILRVFSNINPYGQDRVWRIGEPFSQVVEKFLPQIKPPLISGKLLQTIKITKSLRTHYDHIMLQLHNKMKKDLNYQQTVSQTHIAFPPGSTWIVQTDDVSHAAISGQFVLEQTFYLPISRMNKQTLSPLRILEKKLQRNLV